MSDKQAERNYPQDEQFEDVLIASAEQCGEGWSITREDGWGLWMPNYDGEPQVGSALRIYGKGIGHPFRGLYVDGVCVFYRTEAEDEEHRDIQMYGRDAQDLLERWDAGQGIWSISVGGLGPGYEQAIQVAMIEVLRFFLAPGTMLDEHSEARKVYGLLRPVLYPLGLSGAQWGAAFQLAADMHKFGPRILHSRYASTRHIQVSRDFPIIRPIATKELTVRVRWSDEDELQVAEIDQMPGCTAHGDNEPAALRMLADNIEAWRADLQERA